LPLFLSEARTWLLQELAVVHLTLLGRVVVAVAVGVVVFASLDVLIDAERVIDGVIEMEGFKRIFTVAELAPLVLLLAWKNTDPPRLVDWNCTEEKAMLKSTIVAVSVVELELDMVTVLPLNGKERSPFDTDTVSCMVKLERESSEWCSTNH